MLRDGGSPPRSLSQTARSSAMFTYSDSAHSMDRTCQYTETLVDCMQERLELLEALRALADAQAAASEHPEIDTTLSLLARKQALLQELANIQEKLSPYMRDDPNQRLWSSSDRRQHCQQLADQGQHLLQATLQLEQHSLEKMTSRRDAVAAQLRDGQDSILAHTAYRADQLLGESILDISSI
jgi:hypothetical protein